MRPYLKLVPVVFLLLLPSAAVAQQDAADFSEAHPGLLGLSYLESQFVSIRSPKDLRAFDNDINGMSAMLNVPAPWTTTLPDFLGQDLFVSSEILQLEGSSRASGFHADLELTVSSVSAGITTFANVTSDIRPFVQLGYSGAVSESRVHFPPLPALSTDDTDFDGAWVVNPGVELDITDQLAWRTVLEVETEERFEDSFYRSELVMWPTEWLYVRSGVVGDVDGELIGGLVGGGIAW
jgi:hypothetical protein